MSTRSSRPTSIPSSPATSTRSSPATSTRPSPATSTRPSPGTSTAPAHTAPAPSAERRPSLLARIPAADRAVGESDGLVDGQTAPWGTLPVVPRAERRLQLRGPPLDEDRVVRELRHPHALADPVR